MCLLLYSRRSKTQWFFLILLSLVGFLILVQWNFLLTPRMRRFSSRLGFKDLIITGWEPDKIFPVGRFIHPGQKSFVQSGNKTCPKDSPIKSIIIVCSNAANHEQRVAIRNTWGLEATKNNNISVIFMLGVSQDSEVNERVTKENEAYNDIVVGNFIDTPENATLKSVVMLKWISEVCDTVNYIMKTVDDAFINVASVVKYVDNEFIPKTGALFGALRSKEPVQRDSISDRFMPKYMYPYETYPDYLGEAGYFMSVDVARALYRTALITSYIYLEDVFITGVCAESAKIKRSYDFRFYPLTGTDFKFDCSVLFQKTLIVHSRGLKTSSMFENYDEYKKCFP